MGAVMNETATLNQELSAEDRAVWKAEITERIDHLSKQERLVIALHYNEELTVAEIAQVLDISERMVKKVLDITTQKLLRG